MESISLETRVKQPAESRLYTLDFSEFPELQDGAVISNVQSVDYEVVDGTESTPLAISGETTNADGNKVQARIGEGTDQVLYKVTAVVDTDAGDVLEGEGYLWVYDY